MSVMNDDTLRSINQRAANSAVAARPQDEIQVEEFMEGKAMPGYSNTAWYHHPIHGSFNNFVNYYNDENFRKVVHESHFTGIQSHTEVGMSEDVILKPFPVAPHGELNVLNSGESNILERRHFIILTPEYFPTLAEYEKYIGPEFTGPNVTFLPAVTIPVASPKTAHFFVRELINYYAKDPVKAKLLPKKTGAPDLLDRPWDQIVSGNYPLILAAAAAKRRLYIRLMRQGAALGGLNGHIRPKAFDDEALMNFAAYTITPKATPKVTNPILAQGDDGLNIDITGSFVNLFGVAATDDTMIKYEVFYEDALDKLRKRIPLIEASSASEHNGVLSGISLNQ